MGGGGRLRWSFKGYQKLSHDIEKILDTNAGYQSLESQLEKEKPQAESITWGSSLGGARGIRTLDEALHPILP